MGKKLNSNSLKLLISNTLFRGGKNVFQIFLNIFLWKETKDIQIVALFNIVFFVSHYLGVILSSFFVRYGYRRIIHLISFVGLIISYGFFIYLGERVLDNIFLVGILFGLFNGIYYMNYNVNQFDLTTFKNRGNFEGIKKSLKIISRMFYPAFFGTIISFYDINIAFAVGIVLFIFAYYLGDVKFDYEIGKTHYKKFINKSINNKKILFSILGTFFFTLAFSIPLIELIVPILIYNEVGTEIKLGFSLSLLSVISIIVMYLFGKLVDYKHYNKSLIILNILYIISLLGLVLSNNYTLLLLFSSIVIALISLYGICTSVITNNSLHSIKNFSKYRVEFNVFKETGYVLGWILGFLLMYISGDLSIISLKFIFYSMISMSIISTLFLIKINMHEIEN